MSRHPQEVVKANIMQRLQLLTMIIFDNLLLLTLITFANLQLLSLITFAILQLLNLITIANLQLLTLIIFANLQLLFVTWWMETGCPKELSGRFQYLKKSANLNYKFMSRLRIFFWKYPNPIDTVIYNYQARPYEARAFEELRRYHTRTSQINWGPKICNIWKFILSTKFKR